MIVPSSIERIAPFPPIVVELLNAIPLRPDCNLVELIRRHPGLTREIARVAIESERCNAEEALDEESVIARLAPADLAKVAITIAIHDYLQDAFNLPEDRGYWAYTLACALCCAELSEPGKLDPLLAYAAGMLHDVGRLALIQAYPEKYANLLTLTNRMFANDQSFDLLSYERMLFGLDHFATAAWLAVAWRLPVWLRPIVGKFDEGASVEHRKLIETVRAGTRLAHSLGFGFLKAAPRMEVRTIINQLPGARERWKSLDAWQLAEEHLRLKIQTRLMWYGVLSSHGT